MSLLRENLYFLTIRVEKISIVCYNVISVSYAGVKFVLSLTGKYAQVCWGAL